LRPTASRSHYRPDGVCNLPDRLTETIYHAKPILLKRASGPIDAMNDLPNLGEVLRHNARIYPDQVGARDLERAMTFREWNARSCRLANALIGLGLAKGDRVAVLAYNRVEWLEIYAAAAKAGLVAVPINFRLAAAEIRFIVENCEAAAVIVQDELVGPLEEVRADLAVPSRNFIQLGGAKCPPGYRPYEDLLAAARDSEPGVPVSPGDPWTLMYTSGTTGRPKGAIRSHRAGAHLSLITEVEMGFGRRDTALLVMPLCHANSMYFAGAFAYCGAGCAVYSRKSFDPEHLLRTLADCGATFTSLVPTHYVMMLDLPAAARERYGMERLTKLLVSSAPARRDTKLAIMDFFRNCGLYELYGSTETGWVTMLHPEEQFTKLGSVGRECVGSAPIRLLDPAGNEVAQGEAGELYSCNPYTFDGYWRLPEKTREAFRGDYCSVGDLARRDQDGFYYLAGRKSNMIISGGENIYPSEVENLLGGHAKVKEATVIGVPDATWGERVHAVIVLHEGAMATAAELVDWCKDRIAGYKGPRSISFIRDDDMPRTATGKILYHVLKDHVLKARRLELKP
jgi:acyl-CoA synthetase (AMP-forming)/AMP-acid ligase II